MVQVFPLVCILNTWLHNYSLDSSCNLEPLLRERYCTGIMCISLLRKLPFSCLQVHRELMPEHQHPIKETLRPNCVTSTGNWKQRATAKDRGSWSGWNMSEERLNSDLTWCWQGPSVLVPGWSSVVTTYWKTLSTRSCATRVKTCREASFTWALWEKKGEQRLIFRVMTQTS